MQWSHLREFFASGYTFIQNGALNRNGVATYVCPVVLELPPMSFHSLQTCRAARGP